MKKTDKLKILERTSENGGSGLGHFIAYNYRIKENEVDIIDSQQKLPGRFFASFHGLFT